MDDKRLLKNVWLKASLLILVIHLVTNATWIYFNNTPPSWDAASHTSIAIDIARNIRNFNLVGILSSSNYYPVFVHTIAALLIVLFGINIKLIQFTGTMFFLIGISCTFLYAKIVTGKVRSAFFAAAIYSFFPIVFGESRRMMLDIPLTALFALSLYLLERSNLFRKKIETIFFFISVGLLLLTKWTGAIFLFVPLIFVLWESFKVSGIIKTTRKTVLGGLLTGLIILPWYISNFRSLLTLFSVNSVGEAGDPINLLSIQNLSFYLQKLNNYLMTPMFFLLLIVSMVWIVRSNFLKKWMFISFLIFSYLIFTFIQNKDARYLMPMLPITSITIAIFLNKIIDNYKSIGRLISYTVLLTGAFYFVILTVRPVSVEGLFYSKKIPVVGWSNFIDINDSLVKKVDHTKWPDEEIVEDIFKTPGESIIAYESEYFNPSTISMYLKKEQYNSSIFDSSIITADPAYLETSFGINHFPSQASIVNYLKKAKYVFISDSGTGVLDIKNKFALEQIRNFVSVESHCSNYIQRVSPKGINCFTYEGEELTTSSDIIVDGIVHSSGITNIKDTSTVTCPWGCSFNVIHGEKIPLNFILWKTYTLPNGVKMKLYEIKSL